MSGLSKETREVARGSVRRAVQVALLFTVVYAAAFIVFDRVIAAPLGEAIASVVSPWTYVSAEDVDEATHEKYKQQVEWAKADVVRQALNDAAARAVDDWWCGLYGAADGETVDEEGLATGQGAIETGESPADQVMAMTLDEIVDLAKQAPDVLDAASSTAQADPTLNFEGKEIDTAEFSAAAVALARSDDFSQAREQGRVLSEGITWKESEVPSDWMREPILLAVDLRNAGVAADVEDGVYRITNEWGNDYDLIDKLYDEVLTMEDYVGLGGYVVESEFIAGGLPYLRYYGDGHEEVRDLSTYSAISNLKEPVFVLGYLVVLLVIAGLVARKSFEQLDAFSAALSGGADGEPSADALPADLAPMRGVVENLAKREDVVRREAHLTERGKNELIAYLAHDTKTPMTSIIGYLSILAEEPDLPPAQRQHYLEAALDKANRLDGMIDEFFEIARFNISSLAIERAWCDPAMLCYQVADSLQLSAAERGVFIEVKANEGSQAFVDAPQLSRALTNVVKNAIAYADEGTAVTLELEREASDGLGHAVVGDVPSADAARQAMLHITVANRGQEISAEHLERIFEKFYREDSARTTERGGAGLGLAIAREIVQAHGGVVTATSEAGVTTFVISLPVEPC